METMKTPTPEELQQLLEKAQRDLQAALEKMTPEERAQAEARAQKAIEEDRASIQKMLDEGAKIAAGIPQRSEPKFCTNCGAPAGGGKFCTNCGNPLR